MALAEHKVSVCALLTLTQRLSHTQFRVPLSHRSVRQDGPWNEGPAEATAPQTPHPRAHGSQPLYIAGVTRLILAGGQWADVTFDPDGLKHRRAVRKTRVLPCVGVQILELSYGRRLLWRPPSSTGGLCRSEEWSFAALGCEDLGALYYCSLAQPAVTYMERQIICPYVIVCQALC